MFKFVALALVLTVCSGQRLVLNSGLSGLSGLSDDSQYILVQSPVVKPTTLSLSPYLSRQAISIPASHHTIVSQPRIVTQVAHTPRVVHVEQPRILSHRAQSPRVVQVVQRPRFLQTEEISGPPQPYNFGFQSTDEFGTTLSRSETADGSGAVKGSYSYIDADGLTRVVEYIADAAGYRAQIKTNEPGTANANPADVEVHSEDAPSATQQKVAAYSTGKVRVI